MKRRVVWARAWIALCLSLVLLAGCGVETDPDQAVPARWVNPPTVSDEARQTFATPEIDSAYAMVTRFALERSFDPALIDPQRTTYTADELNAPVLGRMTPALADRWKARVTSALAGNAEDRDGLRVLQFFDWEQPTWTVPKDGDIVVNQWIRDAQISVAPATEDDPQRMQITFVQEATLRFEEDQVGFKVTMVKQVTYWVLPNPGGESAWLIDGYEGAFSDDGQTPTPAPSPTPVLAPQTPVVTP